MHIYCDESGNTGVDLLSVEQPVFALASTSLDAETCEALLRLLRGADQREVKYTRLKGTARGQQALISLFESGALHRSNTKACLADKRFYAISHLVDKLIEPPLFERGFDLYAADAHVNLVNVWYYAGPSILGDGHWNKVLKAFVAAVRVRSRASFQSFDEALDVAMHHVPADSRDFAVGLYLARGRLDEFIGVYTNHEVFDPAVDLFISVVSQWMSDRARPHPITTLRSVYDRSKTRYEHQWWAMQVLGFRKAEEEGLAQLATFLEREAVTAPGTDYLVGRGMVWLYQHKYIAMAPRDLRTMAVRSMATTELGLLRLIHEQVPPALIARWFAKVMAPHAGERSALEWLQKPPRKKSVNAIRERMERIEFLKALGVHKLEIHRMYQEKIKAYAQDLKNMRPAKFRELQDPTRSLRLVCFLQWALFTATDAAIMMGANRVNKLVSNAYKDAETLEAKSSRSVHEAIVEIFDKAGDPAVQDGEFRQYVLLLKEQYEPPRFSTRAAAARWILSEPNPEVRALLSELGKLDLQGEEGNEAVQRAAILQTLYRGKEPSLPHGLKIPMPRPWRDIIEGEDRERALRAVEAATLIGLRKALKSGAAFVTHSTNFRGRKHVLIGDEDWQRDRLLRFSQLSLPLEAGPLLDSLVDELRLKLNLLAEAIHSGRQGLANGRFHIPRLTALAPRAEVKQNKVELFAKIGIVQFPELILDMDSRTGFSKLILGRTARSGEELLEVYAGMIAHGCALDASQVALTMPQLNANNVLRGMQLFDNTEALHAANAAVVNFHKRLPICAAWGDGSLASSDMMSMDVSKHIWAARMDYRRKLPSIGTYTLVADFWSVLYDMPIILNERQAGAALEAAVRQTEVEIDRLAVDTHGYTDFAMALAKLLGFALCPRFAQVAERKLFIPSGMKEVDEVLDEVVQPVISLRLIKEEWDNLVRLPRRWRPATRQPPWRSRDSDPSPRTARRTAPACTSVG
jgi:hypothetical protein